MQLADSLTCNLNPAATVTWGYVIYLYFREGCDTQDYCIQSKGPVAEHKEAMYDSRRSTNV